MTLTYYCRYTVHYPKTNKLYEINKINIIMKKQFEKYFYTRLMVLQLQLPTLTAG